MKVRRPKQRRLAVKHQRHIRKQRKIQWFVIWNKESSFISTSPFYNTYINIIKYPDSDVLSLNSPSLQKLQLLYQLLHDQGTEGFIRLWDVSGGPLGGECCACGVVSHIPGWFPVDVHEMSPESSIVQICSAYSRIGSYTMIYYDILRMYIDVV